MSGSTCAGCRFFTPVDQPIPYHPSTGHEFQAEGVAVGLCRIPKPLKLYEAEPVRPGMLAIGDDGCWAEIWVTADFGCVARQPAEPEAAEPPAAEPVVKKCRTCRYWDCHDERLLKGDCRAPGRHRYWAGTMTGEDFETQRPFSSPFRLDAFGPEETGPDFSCAAWDAGPGSEPAAQPEGPEVETQRPQTATPHPRSANPKRPGVNRPERNPR